MSRFSTGVGSVAEGTKVKPGAKLFKDFQVLSRVWTHPWCLHLRDVKVKIFKSLQCES